MSTPSVELSSYRDQHFKVILDEILNYLAKCTKFNLKQYVQLSYKKKTKFRDHGMNRKNC